ncbi:MAG: hypothetical protein KKA64_00190 [Nanoarchaeota archaeon]|nr:hypothetical protein [Nanoarchaeota archaeon]
MVKTRKGRQTINYLNQFLFILSRRSENKRGNQKRMKYTLGKKRKAQVWIETVIYTLIALVLIAGVLAFIKPKIQEMQDKAIIEQSIELIDGLDKKVLSAVEGAPGNSRLAELIIKKGVLEIDGVNDKIVFRLDESKSMYSQPGRKNISIGNINIYTEKKGSLNSVSLTRDYKTAYNIQYEEMDKLKTITKGPTSYNILIVNEGVDSESADKRIIINIIPTG